MRLADSFHNFLKKVFRVVTVLTLDRKKFKELVIANLEEFKQVWKTDWASYSEENRAKAVERIKDKVIDGLIPTASTITIAGAPGLLVYTPCQVVGGLAIARIRQPEFDPWNMRNVGVILGLLFWGKVGQVAWHVLVQVIGDLIPTSVLSIAVVPYVQHWTRMALDRVDGFYCKTELPNPQAVTDGPQLTAEDAMSLDVMQEAKNSPITSDVVAKFSTKPNRI